jgi:hypothetical protein
MVLGEMVGEMASGEMTLGETALGEMAFGEMVLHHNPYTRPEMTT